MKKRKKGIVITFAILLTVILGFASYFYVWGGEPYIEDFEKVSDDYEALAQLALNTYSEFSSKEEYIIIDIYDGNFKYNNSNLPLTEAQQKAVQMAGDEFDFLRVCKDAVFFCDDETGYYGLVYSKNPLAALYKAGLPRDGRKYHRINSRWYEWGVWGI